MKDLIGSIEVIWFKSLAISLIAVFAPLKETLLVVGFLIFADLFLGVMAAHKRGEEITSAGFRRTVVKMFVYQTTIITGFLVEKYLLHEFLPVVKLITGTIGLVELKSVLENTKDITNADFSSVLKKLGSDNETNNKEKK